MSHAQPAAAGNPTYVMLAGASTNGPPRCTTSGSMGGSDWLLCRASTLPLRVISRAVMLVACRVYLFEMTMTRHQAGCETMSHAYVRLWAMLFMPQSPALSLTLGLTQRQYHSGDVGIRNYACMQQCKIRNLVMAAEVVVVVVG